MSSIQKMNSTTERILLPHHKQLDLCTTRLPYRQGRKLTAVKVYTINSESNHLLVFGVPSLNLRQEAKSLFSKFGKLLQFNQTTEHISEQFTETYHAKFEKIQSARIAKRMLDTKNFYGGSLHVCYAPEYETLEETKQKLMQRQRDVLYRLRNLEYDVTETTVKEDIIADVKERQDEKEKVNMGIINTIVIGKNNILKRKNIQKYTEGKKFKPCFINNEVIDSNKDNINNKIDIENSDEKNELPETNLITNDFNAYKTTPNIDIEIVDCTSTENETITNINESLNYNKFGDEVIKKIPVQKINRIQFNMVNKNK